MKYLILMTSTYGKGDAPANAGRFIKKFKQSEELQTSFHYSVVGFGSRSYPDFCQFAIDLDQLLDRQPSAFSLLPIYKVDDNEKEIFHQWVDEIGNKLGVNLKVKIGLKAEKTTKLKVTRKEFSKNPLDHTFLLELSFLSRRMRSFESGDLMVITPANGATRYYSMSVDKGEKTILLSIKKHEKGIVSNDLAELSMEDDIEVSFKENQAFHFPKKASGVLLIANGTGIAPFLGMLESNDSKIPASLFWGGQNQASFDLYKSTLNRLKKAGKLERWEVAYSRISHNDKYVQSLVEENRELVIKILENNGVIMICGSLDMQAGVEEVLEEISSNHFSQSLDYFNERKMIRADCY